MSLEKLKGIDGVVFAKACQIIHPREIFADEITDRAAGIIFVHNHPTSDTEPSTQDIQITKRLVEVGKIVGIEVIDHIIKWVF